MARWVWTVVAKDTTDTGSTAGVVNPGARSKDQVETGCEYEDN